MTIQPHEWGFDPFKTGDPRVKTGGEGGTARATGVGPTTLTEDAEQLPLAHPFVKRILDRFLGQGFGAHDVSRITAVVFPDDRVVRIVAYARLTLFGTGAARLHDQLVPIAAAWPNDSDKTDRGTL